MAHQKFRRRHDVDEKAGKNAAQPQTGGQEYGRGHDAPVGAQQIAGAQALPLFNGQRFRQVAPAGEDQRGGQQHHEGEDRAPAESGLQVAANDRRGSWRDGEHHGHVRHHALRRRTVEQIAHNGAAEDDAGAGRHALNGAQQPQMFDARGKYAGGAGKHEDGKRNEDNAAAP